MPKKVILFGCQLISIKILRFLASREDIEISKVFTYELLSDTSRGQESIKTVASELGLSISSPSRISKELIEEVKNLNPDLIISCYYRKIFPRELLEVPSLGIINIHPSLLPYYRGPVPTAWAILNGESEFGITIHKVDSGIDTGDILVQQKYKIGEDETGYELYLRAMKLGADLFSESIDKILMDGIKPVAQAKGGSYYGKLNLRTMLDWKQSAEKIKNCVRVQAQPYNPIHTVLENKYFFINKITRVNVKDLDIQQPGRILRVYEDDRLLVSCADGAVIIEKYDVYPPFTSLDKAIYLKVGRRFESD